MKTRDEVLTRLKVAGSNGVSGESVAAELHISRAAVAKHVAALRALGYVIDAAPGFGYRLDFSPDLPIPAEVAPLVTDPFWVRIEGAQTTGSTNDDARALARQGAPEGSVVVAGRQTRGRGRLGREWNSPEGGVYLSVLLRPTVAPVWVSPLALVVGLGTCEALEHLGAAPRLKWPNDVLLDGAKVAGVLLEMSAEADSINWVVAGVGVNVHAPRGAVLPGAGFLETRLPGIKRATVAAAVLDAIASAYRRFVRDGFGALRGEWDERDALRGAEVIVRDLRGDQVAAGMAGGVDRDGRLLVVSSDGLLALPAGEVTLRS